MGIIALTLLEADSYRQAALAAGADDFVEKSTLSTALVPAMRQVARAKGLGIAMGSTAGGEDHD